MKKEPCGSLFRVFAPFGAARLGLVDGGLDVLLGALPRFAVVGNYGVYLNHRAVLDVFAVEPLPPDHAFWSHPRITVLPHTAAQTDARSAAEIAARNVRALRAGQPLAALVDRAKGY